MIKQNLSITRSIETTTMAKKVIKDQPAKNVKVKAKAAKANTMKKPTLKKGGQKGC